MKSGRLASEIEDFLEAKRAEGKSRHTVEESYKGPLVGILLKWCQQEGVEAAEQLMPATVQRFATDLHARQTAKGQSLSKASVGTYLRTLNVFLSWAQVDGRVEEKVTAKLPTKVRKQRSVLSREELDQLEGVAVAERDKLILRLLADTGAREGEIVSITLDDLVEKGRYTFVKLRGKTGERVVPISNALFRRLQTYAKNGRPRGLKTNRLFISNKRRVHGDYEPLEEPGVYQMVKSAAYRLGWEKRVYPHLFRHSAITHMVNRGMHPATISEVTGVSVEVIAQHYTHSSDEDKFRALMKALEADH